MGAHGRAFPLQGTACAKALEKCHGNGLKGNGWRARPEGGGGEGRGYRGGGGELQGPAGPRLGLQGWWVLSRAAPGLTWTPKAPLAAEHRGLLVGMSAGRTGQEGVSGLREGWQGCRGQRETVRRQIGRSEGGRAHSAHHWGLILGTSLKVAVDNLETAGRGRGAGPLSRAAGLATILGPARPRPCPGSQPQSTKR